MLPRRLFLCSRFTFFAACSQRVPGGTRQHSSALVRLRQHSLAQHSSALVSTHRQRARCHLESKRQCQARSSAGRGGTSFAARRALRSLEKLKLRMAVSAGGGGGEGGEGGGGLSLIHISEPTRPRLI
eukprot:1707909-Rhodomonas_salina.1